MSLMVLRNQDSLQYEEELAMYVARCEEELGPQSSSHFVMSMPLYVTYFITALSARKKNRTFLLTSM